MKVGLGVAVAGAAGGRSRVEEGGFWIVDANKARGQGKEEHARGDV